MQEKLENVYCGTNQDVFLFMTLWQYIFLKINKNPVFVMISIFEFAFWQTLAQSISTHYSKFEKMGRFTTLKKQGPWGCKKQGQDFFVIQKENKQIGLFSSKFQIVRRKNMVQTLKKRVDATLQFSRFQTLIKYQVDLKIRYLSGCRLIGRLSS